MRIRYLLMVFPLFLLSATNSLAIERKTFGIGVIAGEPDGITGKYLMKNSRALDFGFGWKTSGANEYQIYGDYLFYKHGLIEVSNGELPLYFGAGFRYIIHSDEGGTERDDEFGIRVPVGIEYFFWNSSLGVFGEFVPVLNLTPDTTFEFGGAIGIRYFF